MMPSETVKKKLKSILYATLVMMAFGALYGVLFSGAHPHVIMNGVTIGFIIGIVSSTAELFYFQTRRKRFRFWVLLLVRSMFYVVLIGVTVVYVIAYHNSLMLSLPISEVLGSEKFRDFLFRGEFLRIILYALVGSFSINFVRQVNRLLGHNALLYYFTGKYHEPVEEFRIFMFLDLKSSTRIAEKLGHTGYHRFLNDFFHDITASIVESKGEVYQYVGDEVVVTWPAKIGLQDANCIKCYFSALAAIERECEKYESRYGQVPRFKVGYHFGPVTTAEIGEVKKQIVFHGDTVNTAARIRSECTKLGKDLLLSTDLLSRLEIQDMFTPANVGQITLMGKEEPVELFTFLEAA